MEPWGETGAEGEQQGQGLIQRLCMAEPQEQQKPHAKASS